MPTSDRERALLTRGTFLFHLRPVRLPKATIRWTHTFGLGGTALVLWCALALSGALMLLVYQPVAAGAHDSIRSIEAAVRGGSLVRGVHYWSANLLVVTALLHMLRVLLTGGFYRPRRLNWLIGVALLLLVLASAFTGYLLPWDQRAFWAVTISASMLAYVPAIGEGLQALVLAGPEISDATLLSFYAWHTTFLPVLAIVGMSFHFWRVRKAKGVIEPPASDGEGSSQKVMFLPDLLLREVAQALVVLALVVLLAALAGAPIGEAANPGMSPNPAKAAWYFMGFQELLIHLQPVYAVFVLPMLGLIGLLLLPWLGDQKGATGRWFLSGSGARSAAFAALLGIALTAAAVLADDLLVVVSPDGPGGFDRGLLPTLGLVAVTVAMAWFARSRWRLDRNESLQVVAVFLLSIFTTLTVIGIWFRGEGMALCAPWQI